MFVKGMRKGREGRKGRKGKEGREGREEREGRTLGGREDLPSLDLFEVTISLGAVVHC